MLKTLVSTPILLNSRKSLLVLPQTHNQLVVFKYGKDKNLSSTLQKANHCQQSSWNAISFLESGNREKVHFPNRKAYQVQVLSWKVHWSQLSNHWDGNRTVECILQDWDRLQFSHFCTFSLFKHFKTSM